MRVTAPHIEQLAVVESSHESPEVDSKHTGLEVSVIIPFTRVETVDSAIESVLRQSYSNNLFEIIVVGNGSSKLLDRWKAITAVETEVLHSPGKSRNLGAAHATGKFLLFLDDDCEAQDGWIGRNLAELERDSVGAVSGRILGKDGRFIARSVDFANFGQSQTNQYREGRLWTATFGIRKSFFEALGGFDESIDVHEDIDFCFRLWRRGYNTVYQPSIKVLHNHGRATIRELIRYQYSSGKKAGLTVEARYPDASLRNKILSKLQSPLLYLIALAPLSVAGTLWTIWNNVREQPSSALLFPFIFVGKLSCHLGILSNLLRKAFASTWRRNGILKAISDIFEYGILKHWFSTPRVLTLYVTSACNAKCQHCFYWQNLNQKADLSLSEIATLSESLGKVDKLLIAGGEPFLRRELPDICELFFQNNGVRIVSIPTNGLTPKLISKQLRRILEVAEGRTIRLNLSLDGTESMHDEIRVVPGNFQKVVETYELAISLQVEYPNLTIGINSCVMDKNYENLFDLYDQLPGLFPKVNLPGLILLRGDPFEQTLQLPAIEDLRRLHRYKTSKIGHRQPWLWKLADLANFSIGLATIRKETQVVPCEAGRILGVVEDNGDVRHCELLPPIGNLRDDSFNDIWNSPKAKEARERIVKKECRCTHECNVFESLVANPVQGLKAVIEEAR